jgi:hypothetical protein
VTTEARPADPAPTRCAAHPAVETYLRCGRCDTPICPRCLIQTPVGARCRACARLRRLPVYDVGPRFLLRGGLAALAGALIGGLLVQLSLGLLSRVGLFGLLLVGALYGYGLAQIVGLATNQKRGASLGWLTIGAMVLGYGASRALLVYFQLDGVPLDFRLSRALSIGFAFDLGSLALLFVGGLIAYSRLR